jgi:cysteine peptidase B
MKSIVLLCLVAVALAANTQDAALRQKFTQFQQRYGRVYPHQDEFEYRFRVFKANMKEAEELQKANPKAQFGVTKFSDLTKEEFAAKYLMNVDTSKYVAPPAKDFSKSYPNNVIDCKPDPTTYNWVSCGATTPIYNQGQCGSCWAFSATETIESYFFLGGNPLTQLAMEQIVDCDTQGTDEGCNGGFPEGAYQYVESAGGIEPLSAYPYTAESGESGTCNFQANEVVAKVTGYSSISGETGLYQQMSSSDGGPVSVCVDASSWQNYQGGVLSTCGTSVDHCVQAVGYNNYGESGAYWIVRNSWGEDWGEQGYIWIEIGQDLCDIGDYATVVTATSA